MWSIRHTCLCGRVVTIEIISWITASDVVQDAVLENEQTPPDQLELGIRLRYEHKDVMNSLHIHRYIHIPSNQKKRKKEHNSAWLCCTSAGFSELVCGSMLYTVCHNNQHCLPLPHSTLLALDTSLFFFGAGSQNKTRETFGTELWYLSKSKAQFHLFGTEMSGSSYA